MQNDSTRADPAPEPDDDAEVPATDPAHRSALLLMIVSPLVLAAAVYTVLKLLNQ